ncbi:acetyl-CoA synthetase-like protein [Gymnopus androsaceus JB14]|uniref:Acetyl-CoA synthetase-like protein n=1 Tax=Gymnopus androsaceus JB14 TaxID=1447944 RepID=A0A6A4HNY4_9AGAR|nr:acetyl-CoA synthetase-like protein [Gymnopus androsaceus JB14]
MGSIDYALAELPSGFNLIPHLIDFRAQHDTNRTCISYPSPGTSKYIDITYGDFGHAVNNAAWDFDSKFGARRSSSEPSKVVGILARSDAAYMVTIYALHKCGIVPLLISPRNSRAAIVNLLKLTNSTAIIVDSFNRSEAEASAVELGSLPVHDIASLPLPNASSKPFPFDLRWEDECDKPVLYLHTSGSTGLPKPVPWNSHFVMHQGYYPPNFAAKYSGSSVLATLPLFHGSGVALTRGSLIWLGWRVMFADPSKPVTANALVEFCKSPNRPDILIGAPSVIEEIASFEGGLDVMRSLKFWFFVGAPVPPHFGSLLVKEKIHFLSMLGSTEIGQMNVLEPEGREPQDWQYHQLRPDLDIVLEPRGAQPGEGPFELIILANKDGWKPGTINVKIGGVEGYSTSDLYQKHPTDPRLFKHSGRADDVVVLSNGEKTLSRPIESCIEAHPHVTTAIVFGTGRTQNGVLVVPSADSAFDPADEVALAAFRNDIWEAVENANRNSPSHSQIWKEMILVTTPGKDLPRTDKGSVRRKEAISLYSEEIDNIYLLVASFTSTGDLLVLPPTLDSESLVPFFARLVCEALSKSVADDQDVFATGMDSLKAIFVRNSLLSALRNDERTSKLVSAMPQNFVAMASATSALALTGQLEDIDSDRYHIDSVNAMVDKYTQSFPSRSSKVVNNDDGGEVVIVTGSTGSLGSFILDVLLEDEHVSKIFCLNRAGSVDTSTRQLRSFTERRLNSTSLTKSTASGRLVFHDVDLTAPFFGLAKHTFQEIHAASTLVIHNAWALNFNWQLSTFEDVHIRGLRNIVDFALTSPRPTPPRIAFTSSIASVGAYTSGPVPEISFDDPTVCLRQGYASSKYVSERILAIAAEKTGLQVLSFRIGQISGDTKHGIWNVTDHVPILLRGVRNWVLFRRIGSLSSLWTPVDDVARTIVEVALLPEQSGTFHITNPHPTPWVELLPATQAMLYKAADKSFDIITMEEWLERLGDSNQSPDDNPAIKLIAFFENNMVGKGIRCKLGIDKTMALSPALAHVRKVDGDMLQLFFNYWKTAGFLR